MANAGESFYNSHVEPDITTSRPSIAAVTADRATNRGLHGAVVGGGERSLRAFRPLRQPISDLATFTRVAPTCAPIRMADVQREARDWPISYRRPGAVLCQAEKLSGSTARGPTAKKARRRQLSDAAGPESDQPLVELGMDARACRAIERHWRHYPGHAPVDARPATRDGFREPLRRFPWAQVEYLGLTPHTCQHAAQFRVAAGIASHTGDKRITCQ